MPSILDFSFILLILGCVACTILLLRNLSHIPDLPPLDGESPKPLCSVIIAARNEQARLTKTVRQLFAQEEVRLEVIVVNDRSTDGTAGILELLRKEFPLLKGITVEALPERWLGKCHACHLGAAQADGEWLLFTDADCWMSPRLIARALSEARRYSADHVTMTPGFLSRRFTVRAWFLLFLLSLSGWMAGANRQRRGSHVGIGAFNLVKREAYNKCGGHQALRMSVVDDIQLGKLLEQSGCRTRAYFGADDLECDWGNSLGECVKLFEKNYFATMKFNTLGVAGFSFFVLLFLVLVLQGAASGQVIGWAAALAPMLFSLPAAFLARRFHWPLRTALGSPLMFLVFWYAMVNSAIVTLRQGGVRWRGTFYTIEELKKGIV